MPSSVLSAPRLQTEDRFSAVVEQAEVAARNYDTYQEWALKTYGDSAKTKTVTRKKYSRIVKILRGEESSSMENSKFRFWVKAKGFRLGLNDGDSSSGGEILYVPASKLTSASGSNCPSPSSASGKDSTKDPLCQYKRVAVVENFYDIIYNVHVEMDGRSGRHAGQKRTYRAVAEMYAFLPREAVTRFLMSCSDCQKRMHLQYNNSPASTPFSVLNNKSSITSSLNVTSATCANNSNTVNNSSSNNNNNGGGSSNSNSRDAGEVASLVKVSNGGTGGDESGQEEDEDEDEAMEEDELECSAGVVDGESATSTTTATSEKVNSSQSNCRVLVDCRLNPVVDVENEICPGINTEGIRSLRHQTGTTHTRQHPDQAISKRTNGPSNKRKVASRSTCAATSTSPGSTTTASAESSSIPKRIRTSQDHHHHHGHHHCQQIVPSSRHAIEGGEEDTEDRSDNLVVVAFDEGNSSNGSLDEVTDETHPIDATSSSSATGTSSAGGGGGGGCSVSNSGPSSSKKNSKNNSNTDQNENSNSIQSESKKSTKGSVESEVEAKLRTRERLLAALTSLNGVAGVGRCKQQGQSCNSGNTNGNNNNNSSNNNTSSIGNSCNSPQPLSPSVSDICTKDEEEDEEDDEEGEGLLAMHAKEANGDFDPERLKAFNMFVRLFVDENLDRMVPISRQPKDKIQAIIDSCHRQFPEFTERARKRIRTYLKSCRRTRRHKSAVSCDSLGTKEVNFGDQLVQQQQQPQQQPGNCNQFINSSSKNSTAGQSNGSSVVGGGGGGSGQVVSFTSSGNSYHMTSSLAEQILATACDNEYQNAKRMRLGLKPLAVDYEELEMASCFTSASSIGTSGTAVQVLRPKNSAHTSSSLLAALCQQQQQQQQHQQQQHQQSESESFLDSGIHKNQSHSVVVDGEAVNATDSLVNNSSPLSSVAVTLAATSSSGSVVASLAGGSNGLASDFTTCKSIRPQAGSTSGHHHYSLNPTEAAMVRQLISGYRESAAFLLRSADELEQLLLRQV